MRQWKFIESPIGGSIADNTRELYIGHIAQCPNFRRVDGRSPYITPDPHGVAVEENSIISYLSLSAGPLGKDVTTMAGRLGAIGYFHRVKTGIGPAAAIPRVMLRIRGLGRAKGPTRRKLTISPEDMGAPNGMPELMRIDQQILLTTVLRGWFFTLRLGGLLDARNPLTPDGRRPILVSDIDPMCGGELARLGDRVEEIMVRISGSKTDRPNQGCVG